MIINRVITKKRLYVGVLFGVVILSCGSLNLEESRSRDELLSDLSPVCQGEGVPEAKGYDPDSEIHPAIVMTMDGEYWDSRLGLRDGWTPISVSETELVLCIGEQEGKTHNFCGGTFSNLAVRPAALYDAKTGIKIKSFYLIKKVTCDGITYEQYKLSAIKEMLIANEVTIENDWRRRTQPEFEMNEPVEEDEWRITVEAAEEFGTEFSLDGTTIQTPEEDSHLLFVQIYLENVNGDDIGYSYLMKANVKDSNGEVYHWWWAGPPGGYTESEFRKAFDATEWAAPPNMEPPVENHSTELLQSTMEIHYIFVIPDDARIVDFIWGLLTSVRLTIE